MIFFPVVKGTAVTHNSNRALANINSKGKIDIISFKDKKKFIGIKIPFIRGLSVLLFGLYFFVSSLTRSQMVLGKEKEDFEEKIAKKLKVSKSIVMITICGIVGAIIGLLGLILIPFFFFSMLRDNGLSLYLVAFIMGVIRVSLLLLVLISIRYIPSIRQFYRNNSAGNLAKASYYNKKIDSYYLSTNFINFIVCGFFLTFFVVSFIVAEINYIYKIFINIALTLASFSIIYEYLKLLEYKNNLISKILIYPVAYLTSEKPTQTEREIAFSALNEVVLMCENEERIFGNLSDQGYAFSVVYSEVKERLNQAGIYDVAETDWLIARTLNKNRNEIKLLTKITDEDYRKIKNVLAKREKRIPLSKIFNEVNFYGRSFYVDKNVLSPRPETELLVEEALKEIKKIKKNVKILDLMTGSGVIAVSIACESSSLVYASDISKSALDIAKKNAKKNNVKIKFIESDIFKNFKKEKFDLIISNPPYIPSSEIMTLEDEVKKYDPIISLDGGEDGLFFYKELAENSDKYLNTNGILILEIGYNQADSVKKMLQKKFKNIKIKKDYEGNNRIIVAHKKD